MNGEFDPRYEAYLMDKRINNAPRLGAAGTYLVASPFTLGLLDIPSPRDSFLKKSQENTFAIDQVSSEPESFNIHDYTKEIHELGQRAVKATPSILGYANER